MKGTETCCAPTIEFKSGKSGSSCCSPSDSATVVGYESKELESIPKASVLGVGCGAPLHHADVKEGKTVVFYGKPSRMSDKIIIIVPKEFHKDFEKLLGKLMKFRGEEVMD